MTTSVILVYILLGSISIAYMIYGKKQRKAVALLAGIGIAVLPYFGLNMWLTVLLSIVMMGLPFVIKI